MSSGRAALRAEIMAEMRAAMEETQAQAYPDMKNAIRNVFYMGGHPNMYSRTGRLANTPYIIPLRGGGTMLQFDAALSENGGYTTGKSPSMLDVLHLTNYGIMASSVGYLNPAKGGMGYWEKAEEEIAKHLYENFKAHFG